MACGAHKVQASSAYERDATPPHHPGFSLVHVLHHHHFADRLARQLDGLERNRDDAENVSTCEAQGSDISRRIISFGDRTLSRRRRREQLN